MSDLVILGAGGFAREVLWLCDEINADRRQWDSLGYTPERLAGAWARIVDAYDEAFPGKALALNVSRPVANDGAVEAIISHALRRVGSGRLCLQHNALSAKWRDFRTFASRTKNEWVLAYRGKATLGFQFTWAAVEQPERFGSRSVAPAFRMAEEGGATYFEIYQADMADDANAAEIRRTARELRNP